VVRRLEPYHSLSQRERWQRLDAHRIELVARLFEERREQLVVVLAVTTNTRQPRSRITRARSIAVFACDRYGLAPALAGLPADAALMPALPLAPALAPAMPAEPALPDAPAEPDAPLVPATPLASPPLAPALDITTGVVGVVVVVVVVVAGVVDGVLEPLGANVIAVAPARRPPELRRHSH
jgi:hypothetical protein